MEVTVTIRLMNLFILLINIMYIMTPGTKHIIKPMMVNSIINHGIAGLPSKVTERDDWLVTFHFPVERKCTALTMTSSGAMDVL